MTYLKKIIPKHLEPLRRVVLLGLLVFPLSACMDKSDDSSDSPLSFPAGKLSISVSNESVFLSKVGSNIQLSAMLVDGRGIALIEQPTFVWRGNAEGVATINSQGLLTAVALGQLTVQVSGGGEVRDIPVEISADMITLNAQVRYEDKEYDRSGFTGRANYFKAVRFAQVDLIAANNVDILQTTYSDATGNFSFTGILNSQQSIRVRAKTNEALGLKLRVDDRSGALYSVKKTLSLSDLNNFMIDISVSSQAAGAFNILDVFTSAAEFTFANTSATSVNLSAFWQSSNADGTYFCSGYDSSYCRQGKGVYVFNSPNGDTDEFDDDVLYHEFAHYFTNELSKDDSPGGCHLLSSRDLDLRLAWSEGWGDFFPVAVKSWLNETNQAHLLSSTKGLSVSSYLDTYMSGVQIYIDLAVISQSRYSSAANEMAVAKILWALTQRFGMPAVVEVLTDYFPKLSTPVNLESFWDGWLFEHNPSSSELAELESFFAERLIFYQEDAYEADNVVNNLRKAILGGAETHYLYSDSLVIDRDLVAFDGEKGKQYTLQTSGLTSGADTYIRVLSGPDSPLLIGGVQIENDDISKDAYYGYDSVCGSSRVKNNSTALASKVTFVAPFTGTYYAEIRTTIDTEPYLSAGRYGTYDLTISQNSL